MLDNIRLTRRLAMVLGAFWVALASIMGLTGWSLYAASVSLEHVHDVRMNNAVRFSQMADLVTANRLQVLLAFQHDPSGALFKVHEHPVDTHLVAIQKNRAEVGRLWSDYTTQTAMASAEQELAKAADVARTTWLARLDEAVSGIQAVDFSPSRMAAFLAAGRREGEATAKALNALRQYQSDQARLETQTAQHRYHLSLWAFALAIFFGAIPATGLAYLLLRRMTTGFATASQRAQAISKGDLSGETHATGRDEISSLLQHMATMSAQLNRLISQVMGGSESIASATAQVASGTVDLSNRTEQQASTLQETAAASEQLATTVARNAHSARTANELATRAAEVAQQGGGAVHQVIATMESIDSSAKKIVDIIAVIDGIAFQTNILALNAAVEAARAGDQGRGFAVVAAEVRNLARRSADAAREVKTLITDSVEKVSLGTQQVAAAGRTMHEIVASIQSVSDIVASITTASNEQATGVGQISQAVSSLDSVTQQNAALVEEASAAAAALKEQARQLADVASQFILSRSPKRQLRLT